MTNTPQGADRRGFLKGAAALGGLSAAASGCASISSSASSTRLVQGGERILFQGDSITDAGRSRETADQPNRQSTLGNGYAWMASAAMLVGRSNPPSIFNRGVSGDKVHQLDERWEADCLALAPDVLSILIGVNDLWHAINGDYDGTWETYVDDFDALLARTVDALPEVKLVICEPFILEAGEVDATWQPRFDPFREGALGLAAKYGATWVGFQEAFNRALEFAPAEHWARDGVHPSAHGSALMAQTWLEAVGL